MKPDGRIRTTRRCAASWSRRRTRWSAGRARCWWSTTPPCPSRASTRSAWPGSTAAPWASGPTARSLVSLPWPGARSRCRSGCGCSCPRRGPDDAGALRPGRGARGAPPRPGQDRARARGDRPRARRRRALRPRGGGRRLRHQRRVPAGPERARPRLGGRHPQGAERLLARGRAALAQGGHGPAPQAPGAERGAGRGRGHAGGRWRRSAGAGRSAEPTRRAAATQGAARGRVRRLCGCARPRARSSGRLAPAGRGGLARGRAPRHAASGSTTSPTCRPTRRSRSWRRPIKARWVCEQAHQQLKEELGLDHFEGRSWTGLHRHALLAMIAFCFLQHLRLRERGKSDADPPGPPPRPTLPAVRRRLLARLGFAPPRCPCCGSDLRPLLPSGVPR